MPTATTAEPHGLLTYSFVSQGIYGVQDRLSGILPFFLPIIKEMQGRAFEPHEFVARSNRMYPWSINTDICHELIPRFCRAGWLKEYAHGRGKTDRSYVVLSITDYDADEHHLQQAVSDLDEIGRAFHELLSTVSPLQTMAYSADELQEMLLQWLVDKRAFERTAILAALETDQPTRRRRKVPANEGPEQNRYQKRDEDYLCARFIAHIAVENDALFEKLVAISAVALVVEVALDIYRPTPETIDLRSCEFYFDGPFAMDLLGLSGKERSNNAIYIFENLRKLSARTYIFAHSCDEVRDNLKGVLLAHPGERFGPTAEAIKRQEVLEDYARSILGDVEGHMERVGLKVRQIDLESYPNTHVYFATDHVLDLAARLPWEDLPSERDAMSVAFVMRLRGGKSSPVLERNRACMVSSNINLADAARRYCMEQQILKGNQVGPVLHRRQLAAMLWLTLGSDEKREVTRRELLQRCADVVRLNPQVVRKARATLASYDSSKASQFEALMLTPRASQMIMDLTLGIPDVISHKNIDEILDDLRRSAAEEIENEYKAEIRTIKGRHREAIKKAVDDYKARIADFAQEKEEIMRV